MTEVKLMAQIKIKLLRKQNVGLKHLNWKINPAKAKEKTVLPFSLLF